MLSTSFCVNGTLAFSSAASLAVSLTTSRKRLFLASRNDCRHAWNAVCCTAICFINTSSCRASALLTMESMSGSWLGRDDDRVVFPISAGFFSVPVIVSVSKLYVSCLHHIFMKQNKQWQSFKGKRWHCLYCK